MTDISEFETAKARNLILTQYFPEYSKRLTDSLRYAKTDPSSSLLKSRQILEDVGKNIWSSNYTAPAPSTYEVFNDPVIKERIPGRLLNRVHSLRNICNLAIHGQSVTQDDVLMSLNHIFLILDWYGTTHKELSELPIAVQPSHSFLRYLRDTIKDKLFVIIIAFHIGIPALLFRFHWYLPDELHRPFKYVYEGVFKFTSFSLVYSTALVVVTLILAWIIFKRFRRQDLESRLLSFELMYSAVFGFQFIFLLLFDYYVTIW